MCRDDYSLFNVDIPENQWHDDRAFERKVEKRLVEIVDSIEIPKILIHIHSYDDNEWRNQIFYELKSIFEVKGIDALTLELSKYNIILGIKADENVKKFKIGSIVRSKTKNTNGKPKIVGKIEKIHNNGMLYLNIGKSYYNRNIHECNVELVPEDDEAYHLFDNE